jgi:amidase
MSGNWAQIAATKQQALRDSIPEEWRIPAHLLPPKDQDDVTTFPATSGWFTPDELAITDATALQLIPKLASGDLKAETVARARFLSRIPPTFG